MSDDASEVTVYHQARFSEAGEVSVDGEVTATSLADFGVEIDDRERATRVDQPQASEFGIDDRRAVTRTNDGEQATLFVDVDETQQTLTGEPASQQCQFGRNGFRP